MALDAASPQGSPRRPGRRATGCATARLGRRCPPAQVFLADETRLFEDLGLEVDALLALCEQRACGCEWFGDVRGVFGRVDVDGHDRVGGRLVPALLLSVCEQRDASGGCLAG